MSTTTTDQIEQSDRLSPSPIPVIDLSRFLSGTAVERAEVAAEVDRTFATIGFMVVTGHGVAQSSIDEMYAVTSEFFALPIEEKMRCVSPVGERHEGFAPNANPYDESPGRRRPVVREMYHSYRFDTPDDAVAAGYPDGVRESMPRNLWPDRPPTMEAVWKTYFGLMGELAGRILHLLAVSLGLPEGWFDDQVDRHLSSMAANLYPEQPVAPEPDQYRVRAHVDFSTVTILYQDGAPGSLQAHKRGAGWVDVPFVPGSFVINLGDLMARWTNDRWIATPHRVLNPPSDLAMTRRISMPFFHLPNHDAVIAAAPTCVTEARPARFEPVVAGEWTRSRRAYSSPNAGRVAV